MKFRRGLVVLALIPGAAAFAFQNASPRPAASPATSTGAAILTVGGKVETPLSLGMEDLAKMPRTTVKLNDEGGEVVYEGVLVSEILKRAGAPGGASLRGRALATYLLCEARDGYRVLFALAELDPDFSDQAVIVADKRDGKPLFDYQGPFRIVAPKDKRAARNIRMLSRLSLVQVPE